MYKEKIIHTKYLLMFGKHQESSYCDKARLTTSKYYFFSKWHQIYFCYQFLYAHTTPLL